MDLSGLLNLITDAPGYSALLDTLNNSVTSETREIKIPLLRAARAYLLAAMQCELTAPLVILTGREERARTVHQQLQAWAIHPIDVLLFPPPDALPYERVPWQAETISQRVTVLDRLTWAAPASAADIPAHAFIVVAAARALMTKTTRATHFQKRRQTIRRGHRVKMSALMKDFYASGYQHVPVVEGPGEFTHRGGIIDIFPADAFHPVRMEFFGNEIDSLRLFNPSTQRSETRVGSVTIPPATEALFPTDINPALDFSSCHYPAAKEYQRDLEHLHSGALFRGAELYLPYLDEQASTLLDYLPDNAWLVIDDWDDLTAQTMSVEEQATQLKEDLIKSGELPRGFAKPHFTWDELKPQIQARSRLVLGHGEWREIGDKWQLELSGEADEILSSPVTELGYAFKPGAHYGGQIKEALNAADSARLSGERVVLISRQAERLADFLGERGLLATPIREISTPPLPSSLTLVNGVLDEGWRLEYTREQSALQIMTDAEIFGWRMPTPRRVAQRKATAPEAFFADVSPGDYVVHLEHGIGMFRGLVKLDLDDAEREYLLVEYAANDRLYVPIHQADRLGRYEGIGEIAPQLHRLGTADWARAKSRTRQAVAEIADELLELYAARESVEGHAFEADTEWQSALEAAFPYLETPDQAAAIEAVKMDMEQSQPMDRLVCGDVGYGKTEVALRAAFKAVMDSKQVAVLVPTTVLAQQHYYTFQERLSSYPVIVEMLSRFRTAKQQREVIAGLKAGTVDIVVGTHRLLQDDIAFKDLGLLIIDEEQRFGVVHKEKLKQMRTEVDVITLTATPIPRTLHMSLVGARDMSLINTPPEERLAVKTYLIEYDETMIRRAILRELDRGGQIFFVHNRVKTINLVKRNLERLVPEAAFVVGHGQMKERELERIMFDFARGKYDVLVCTSIIESGLDMPNVNTIIIDRADRFGLADLYQLRGRVGRGAVRAYAYLMYKKGGGMTPEARKRLRALMDAQELGAGFQLAMRDLEIRGAGDILGARQHGHISAVGFSLYTQLLSEALEQRKKLLDAAESGKPIKADTEEDLPVGAVAMDLPLPVYLPRDYVADEQLRLKLYRRIANLSSLSEVAEMEHELEDRFGALPEPVRNMLYTLQLKALAQRAGVEAITREAGMFALRLSKSKQRQRHKWEPALPKGTRVMGNRVNLDLGENWQEGLEEVLSELGK